VVGPGEVPLSALLRELDRRPIPVPHPIARGLLKRLWDARLSTVPAPELDHIQYLCTADGARFAADAAWKPTLSMRETIHSIVGEAPMRKHESNRPRIEAPSDTAST
jgi:UDP-glucose 4-epimerase